MKQLLIPLAITTLMSALIMACTEEPAPPKNNSYYKQELDIARAELQNCKDENYNLRMGSVAATSTTQEPQVQEDEYEEIQVYVVNGTKCRSGEGESCGLKFEQCDNGMVYQCMMNVAYKVETIKVKVE